MAVHGFSLSRGRVSEFEAILVYRMSFRTARATKKNPISIKQNDKKERTGGTH